MEKIEAGQGDVQVHLKQLVTWQENLETGQKELRSGSGTINNHLGNLNERMLHPRRAASLAWAPIS